MNEHTVMNATMTGLAQSPRGDSTQEIHRWQLAPDCWAELRLSRPLDEATSRKLERYIALVVFVLEQPRVAPGIVVRTGVGDGASSKPNEKLDLRGTFGSTQAEDELGR